MPDETSDIVVIASQETKVLFNAPKFKLVATMPGFEPYSWNVVTFDDVQYYAKFGIQNFEEWHGRKFSKIAYPSDFKRDFIQAVDTKQFVLYDVKIQQRLIT